MIWIMEILKNEFPLPPSSLNNFLLCSYLQVCFNNKTCFLSLEFSSVPTIAMAYISFLLQYYLLTHLKQKSIGYIYNACARNKVVYIRRDQLTAPQNKDSGWTKFPSSLPQSTLTSLSL